MEAVVITCTICSECYKSTDEIYSTNCGHVFHSLCIREWQTHSSECPACRTYNSGCKKIYLNFEDNSHEKDMKIVELKSQLEQSLLNASVLEQHLDESERDFLNIQKQFSEYQELMNEFTKKNEYLVLQNDSREKDIAIKIVEIHRLQEALNASSPQGSSVALQEEINILNEKLKQITLKLQREIHNTTQLEFDKMKLQSMLDHATKTIQNTKERYQNNNGDGNNNNQLSDGASGGVASGGGAHNKRSRNNFNKSATRNDGCIANNIGNGNNNNQLSDGASGSGASGGGASGGGAHNKRSRNNFNKTATRNNGCIENNIGNGNNNNQLSDGASGGGVNGGGASGGGASVGRNRSRNNFNKTATQNDGCNQSILIQNIKETFIEESSMMLYVSKLIKLMNLSLKEEDIQHVSICERNNSETATLLIKFKSLSTKAMFLANKRQLKNCPNTQDVIIKDNVAEPTNNLYNQAKTLKGFGYKHIYCKNNIVFVRKDDGAGRKRINRREDIDKLKSEASKSKQTKSERPNQDTTNFTKKK